MRRVWLAAFVGIFGCATAAISPAYCDEFIRITIYRGWEKDLCPNGYSSTCPIFTKVDFDRLFGQGELQIIATVEQSVRSKSGEKELKFALKRSAISWARRNTASEKSNNRQSALLVVEWLERPAFKQKTQTSDAPVPPQEVGKQKSTARKLARQISYAHAGLRNIDPEEKYKWQISSGDKRVVIVFDF